MQELPGPEGVKAPSWRVASGTCLSFCLIVAAASAAIIIWARRESEAVFRGLGMDKLPPLTELFFILQPLHYGLFYALLAMGLVLKEILIRNSALKLHINMFLLFGMIVNLLLMMAGCLTPYLGMRTRRYN